MTKDGWTSVENKEHHIFGVSDENQSSGAIVFREMAAKLATIERETAEKCAQIAYGINGPYMVSCKFSLAISDHFKLGETP